MNASCARWRQRRLHEELNEPVPNDRHNESDGHVGEEGGRGEGEERFWDRRRITVTTFRRRTPRRTTPGGARVAGALADGDLGRGRARIGPRARANRGWRILGFCRGRATGPNARFFAHVATGGGTRRGDLKLFRAVALVGKIFLRVFCQGKKLGKNLLSDCSS